jgi:integrase
VLTDAELARVWHASEALPPKSRCFVRLLILTGCRVSEAAGIAMGELDVRGARWTIPAARAKNRRAITIPLSALALAELAAIIPSAPPHLGYRLLGRRAGSPLSGVSSVKVVLDEASGVRGWVMHDLRRTCRTTLARLGVPREHAEAALNHIGGRTTLERTYNVHGYEPEIIVALDKWQRHVAAIVSDRPLSAEVIALRRG